MSEPYSPTMVVEAVVSLVARVLEVELANILLLLTRNVVAILAVLSLLVHARGVCVCGVCVVCVCGVYVYEMCMCV